MSSVLPWFFVSDDGVEDSEEFSGDRNESCFLRFAGGDEAAIEGFQDGVEPRSDHRRHEQRGAHARSASCDEALPPPLSGLAGEGTKTSQRRNLLARQTPNLGQFRNEGARRCWADAGYGGQKLLVRPPQRGSPDGRINIAIEVRELFLQGLQQPFDAWLCSLLPRF